MDLESLKVNAALKVKSECVETNEEGGVETQGPAQSDTQPTLTVFDSNPSLKADVWKEFVSVGRGEDGKERGRCIRCGTIMVIERTLGTSHLRRHVRRSCQRKHGNKCGGNDEQDRLFCNDKQASVSEVYKSSWSREGLSNIVPKKRQRSSVSGGKTRSGTLLGLDILDCPVCFEALTIPIFQCDNGHLVCSSCRPKLSNKCHAAACASPVGHNRCRAMESVLKSVFLPCQNAKLGCTRTLSYGKESTHEKECTFSQCSCPALDCNYTGSYTNVYSHFVDDHRDEPKSISFVCGGSVDVQMNIASDKILVLWEFEKRLLFALQCFSEPCGVYLTVRCIAPSVPEVEKFVYRLYYSKDGHDLTYKSPEVKRVLEVSSQTPQDNFMFVPHSLLRGELLEIKLSIGLKLDEESGELPDMGSFAEETYKRKSDEVFVEKEAEYNAQKCGEVKQEKLMQMTQSPESPGYFQLIQAEKDADCRAKMQITEDRTFDYGSIDVDVGQSSASLSSQFEKHYLQIQQELDLVDIKMGKLSGRG